MLKFFRYLLFSLILTAAANAAYSCDLCGCYTPQLEAVLPPADNSPTGQLPTATFEKRSWLSGAYFAVAEQFTHFGTVQIDGRAGANPTGQYLDSSITQLVAGYGLTKQFALQLNLPLIYRSFERPEGFALNRGTEAGPGDLSLLAKFVFFHRELGGGRGPNFEDPKQPRMEIREPKFTISAVVIAGLKFPTGDSRRITEEFNEIEIKGAPESGIHGHDLTLGTGSYDGVMGGQLSMRYQNWFAQADGQFTLRGDGDHQYHFANDLSWSGGPGYYLVRRPDLIVGLQCVCSGEHKDLDRFRGRKAEDTGITSVYLGPRFVLSWHRLSAELGADLPVSIDNSALQVVPNYRIRSGIALSF